MTELSGVHQTALTAAAMRARHRFMDGEPKILDDMFAQALLDMDNEELIARTAALAQEEYLAGVWVMRNRITEDVLGEMRSQGVKQYVLLGAGLDSFALRQPVSNNELTIFEVDDPPLQKWKRERFQTLGLKTPGNLVFAPCDFETSSIRQALSAVGFDETKPAFVSWLGVTQYLTRPAIAATLGWVASLPAGSGIALTFVVPGPVAERHKALMASRGTRFETFFTPDEMSTTLSQSGLSRLFHYTPECLQESLFGGRCDSLVAPTIERIVVAHVTDHSSPGTFGENRSNNDRDDCLANEH
jgi:methyltransferase (TIGR00027 family)